MGRRYTTAVGFATLIPVCLSASIPPLTARADTYTDVIRFLKCPHLYSIHPGVGGWEQGMTAYWKDQSAQGPPDYRSMGDLYTATEDFFYNGKGIHYGGPLDPNGGFVDADFTETQAGGASGGIHIGYATKRVDGDNKKNTYHCFTDGFHDEDAFTYQDEQYGLCKSWVWCTQKNILTISALASEEVVHARDMALPKPADIYSHFSEVYKNGQCDASKKIPLPNSGIGGGCTVSFDCANADHNDNDAIMKSLIKNLGQFTDQQMYNETTEGGFCSPSSTGGPCLQDPGQYTYRTMPSTTQLIANQEVPPGSDTYGSEVAHIKTTIECAESEIKLDKFFCSLLGGLFTVGGLTPETALPAAIASLVVTTACGTTT